MSERLDERQARREGAAGEIGGETMQVPVNMYQADDALVVVAPLPGVMPDDVEVSIEPRRLTIRASMRSAAPKDYLLHEWHYGPFERVLEIPEGFGGAARASFGNGQLALSLSRGPFDGDSPLVVRPGRH